MNSNATWDRESGLSLTFYLSPSSFAPGDFRWDRMQWTTMWDGRYYLLRLLSAKFTEDRGVR